VFAFKASKRGGRLLKFEEHFGISAPAMIGVVLGVFMAVLDTSIVNVAIPKMMTAYSTDQSTIEWVLTIYTLTEGMLTPVSGYMADRFGAKRMYQYALLIFVLGSALCGVAWSVSTLIAFRMLQAVGGALLMPISMTILYSLSKPEKRGLIMGIWGIAIMFAPAFGPTLSGYIVQYFNFRLIFYINVPIGIINFFVVQASVRELPKRFVGKFDLPGFITGVGGFFCLLYALTDASTSGWLSIKIISFFTAAAILLSLFVVFELTTDHPMVELRLFKIPSFLVCSISVFCMTVAMMGILFLLPIFLQNTLGFSPLQTGLLMMPGALLTAVLMPISGTLFDKFGAKPLAITGVSIMLTATLCFVNLNFNWTYGAIMAVYILRSAGMGLSMMPMSTAGLSSVPLDLVNRGSALQNTLRNLASAVGVAILGSVLTTHYNFSFASYMQNVSVQSLQRITAYGLHPSVYGITNPSDMTRIMTILKQLAFENGIHEALIVAVFIATISLTLAFSIPGKKKSVTSNEERVAFH
jgi:DHA2 family multidrug resistance protein